jgi:hypothetical protein
MTDKPLFTVETKEVWTCTSHQRIDCPECAELYVRQRTNEAIKSVIEKEARKRVN